jgi:hypothetical protein
MKAMDSHRWQIAAGVLLDAEGAVMAVAGYVLSGLAALAVGVATTLARK